MSETMAASSVSPPSPQSHPRRPRRSTSDSSRDYTSSRPSLLASTSAAAAKPRTSQPRRVAQKQRARSPTDASSSQSSPSSSLSLSPTSSTATDLRQLRLTAPSASQTQRPCDACRKRKTRCVLVQGSAVCGFCRSHGKDCTYVEPARARRSRKLSSRSASASDDATSEPAQTARDYSVVPSVESDDSVDPAVEDDSIMHRISPARFASTAEIFFQVIWPSYPIIAKDDVLGSLHPSGSPTPGQLLLAAICVVTLQTTSVGSMQKFEMQAYVGEQNHVPGLARFVDGYLRKSAGDIDIKTVKAALLLSNRADAGLKQAANHFLSSVTVRGAACLTANASPQDVEAEKFEADVATRWAYWAHTLWASLLAQTDPDPVSQPKDTSIFVKKEGELSTESSCFRRFLELTRIAEELLNAFGAVAGHGRETLTLRQALIKAKPIQLKLKTWFAELPPDLAVDQVHPLWASAAASLHLAYYAAEIALHGRIIEASRDDDTSRLRDIVRPAARTRLICAMDFVNRLRPRHFASFWIGATTECFASIVRFGHLLMATAESSTEAAFYASMLAELRWTLQADAKYAPFLDRLLIDL